MDLTGGSLYGQTPLDESESVGLKISMISTQGELNQFEQANIERAIKWLRGKTFTPAEVLSEEFVRRLHRRMFGEVWKWAGDFRRTEKNIGVSWVKVALELKILLEDTKYWIDHEVFPETEIAIRFKHRLVSIHCFPNGNGRHSRIMADVLMENVFVRRPFSWTGKQLSDPTSTRKAYINALREGDRGEFEALISFAQGTTP
ncbi:mobile mystery protein B [Lewinella sp. W8]|uniref:mobile mystery protein B n=1 Tax=Lewinella sp. W8 TaxID=2528208 RepID=UPI0010684872|nr:mobile mystery protein B [Lewinella sp. W8]MTB51988.1 mobile mystery protein B [Lewinella sp. W8]